MTPASPRAFTLDAAFNMSPVGEEGVGRRSAELGMFRSAKMFMSGGAAPGRAERAGVVGDDYSPAWGLRELILPSRRDA